MTDRVSGLRPCRRAPFAVCLSLAAGIAGSVQVAVNGAFGRRIGVLEATAPRIGSFATIGLLIAGQLAAGAVIDALGLFGLARIPVTATRSVGLALLAAGAVLVLKR